MRDCIKGFLLFAAVLTFGFSPKVNACTGSILTGNINPDESWQLIENVEAGSRFTFTMGENEVIIFSFCRGGASYLNNPVVEIGNADGTDTYASNDDHCGYGSELIWVCPATDTYSVSFYQFGCIADSIALGTVSYKFLITPTEQDCLGAIQLCTEYYEDTVSHSGSGNYYDIFNFNEQDSMAVATNNCPNCLVTGERNCQWFTFSVQQGGYLRFTIDPFSDNDDYDWALYSLNNGVTCEDLVYPYENPPVSCNYSYMQNGTGNTGIDSGPETCQGPVADMGFNSDLYVATGEKYALVISNFSSSQNGFSLDFSESTADITDTVPPALEDIIYPLQCGSTSISLQFSELILCSSVQTTDFVLTGPGGVYEISQVYSLMSMTVSANTYSGTWYDDVWTLQFNDIPLPTGDYVLTLNENSVSDKCGNTNETAEISFSVDCVDSFILTININGEGSVNVNGIEYSEPITVIEGTELSLEAIAQDGWQFESWTGDLTGSLSSENLVIGADKTITANFGEMPPEIYNLTVFYSGSGVVNVNGELYSSVMSFEEGTIVEMFAIPDAGWEFDHWETDLSGNINPEQLLIDTYKVVTAVFTEIPVPEYILSIDIIGEGVVNVDGVDYTEQLLIQEGTEKSLTAIPAENWMFSTWSGDLSGNTNPETILIDANKNVIVTFLNISYIQYPEENATITVSPNPFANKLEIKSYGDCALKQYQVINSAGQIVLTGSLYEETSINTECLTQGIYFLKILNDSFLNTFKIVKE